MGNPMSNGQFMGNQGLQQSYGNYQNFQAYQPIRGESMADDVRPIQGAPSPMVLSDAARNYRLNSMEYSQLPVFHGYEEALTFLREYMEAINGFTLNGVSEEEMLMKCFPMTLKEGAKQWWLQLPPNSLRSWDEVSMKFTNQYFPYEKTDELRAQISEFRMRTGELFHESWDRFKRLLFVCPHHSFGQKLLNHYFYVALSDSMQNMVDTACGGAMVMRTAPEVLRVFETLATNSRMKGRSRKPVMEVKECAIDSAVVKELEELRK